MTDTESASKETQAKFKTASGVQYTDTPDESEVIAQTSIYKVIKSLDMPVSEKEKLWEVLLHHMLVISRRADHIHSVTIEAETNLDRWKHGVKAVWDFGTDIRQQFCGFDNGSVIWNWDESYSG